MSSERRASHRQEIDVKSRSEHALEELRVVVPGNQALLGFQFVVVFSSGFDSLSPTLKALHFVSVMLLLSMATLALGISLELGVIGRVITGTTLPAQSLRRSR